MKMNVEQALNTINTNVLALANVENLHDHTRNVAEMMVAVRTLGRAATGQRSGKAAILDYLTENVGEIVDGTELAAISGMADYGRRIRELRADGWRIIGGQYKPTEYERRLMRRYQVVRDDVNARQYVLLSKVPMRKPRVKQIANIA